MRPIVDAGLAELVETDHRITDEVWLGPTPGHTPGHVSVRIQSDGPQAVITGDLMHHLIQCSEPDRAVNFDTDRDLYAFRRWGSRPASEEVSASANARPPARSAECSRFDCSTG